MPQKPAKKGTVITSGSTIAYWYKISNHPNITCVFCSLHDIQYCGLGCIDIGLGWLAPAVQARDLRIRWLLLGVWITCICRYTFWVGASPLIYIRSHNVGGPLGHSQGDCNSVGLNFRVAHSSATVAWILVIWYEYTLGVPFVKKINMTSIVTLTLWNGGHFEFLKSHFCTFLQTYFCYSQETWQGHW